MKISNCFFFGSAVGLCVAATLASPDVSVEPSHDSLVVPKTVVSSRLRFVFTVGLEGTGHHYVGEVKNHLFETNKELVGVSHDENINPKFYTMGHSMGGNAQHYTANLDAAKENMRGLAETAADFEAPGTVVFMSGKNSYPNGTGPDKALQYMDLRMIAEVAEMEGVDFRVLYLRRPVKDTLIANTIHRHFQTSLHNVGRSTRDKKYMEYVQILFADIAVMHSLLAELGPGFVVCHDFERFGDVDQATAISEFLAPNEDVAAMLSTSFVEVAGGPRPPSNESLLYEGADVVAARLQRKFDTFESEICSGVKND